MNLALFTSDIKILLRGRWWYVFVVFSALVPLLSLFSENFPQYLFYVYSVGPLFFLPAVSTTIAVDRHRGTIRNFFTTPMSGIDYILSKFLQWFTLGTFYILITLPISLAYCYTSGSLSTFLTSVLYSLLTFFFLTSLGILISMMVKSMLLFPMAVASVLSVLFYIASLAYPYGLRYSTGLALLRASPLVPMGDALGMWSYSPAPLIVYHIWCSSCVFSFVFLLILSIILLAASCIIFCKAQNIFGQTRRLRVYVLAALLVIVPFMIPVSDYFVGSREFIKGGSSSFEMALDPETIVYNGSAVEATLKIFVPHGMSGLRNVTLALYSPSISFIPSNYQFEYPNLRSEEGRAFFYVPVRIKLTEIKGFIYGSYDIDATITARETSDFLHTSVRIENRNAEILALVCFMISIVLPLIVPRRFSYE
jgi:hypothetical protein